MKEVNVDHAWEKLKNRIVEDKPLTVTKERSKVFHLSAYMRVAAMVLLIIGIGFISTKIYTNISKKSALIEYIANSIDGNEIILADGTIVFLNTNSKLVYPKNFSATERKVTLFGEAFFDVTKNPNKPFIIEAKNAEIKVLGTSFNVNTNLPDKEVEVLVESGTVQVTKKNGPDESVIVFPGGLVTVTKNSINQIKNTDENKLAWKTKHIIFKEESLNNVITTLNKVYKTNITCNDESILNLRFNSTFKNQDLDSILSVICLAFDLKTDDKDNEIQLIKNII